MLKVAEVVGIPHDKCSQLSKNFMPIRDDLHLCAYKQKTDACQGDSGGKRVTINGITPSWGWVLSKGGCD